jgi:excisionase family DNA binding protein
MERKPELERDREREREKEQPILLKAEQVCSIVNLGRSKVYELIATRQIPSISIGRSRRVLREDLMAWIEKQRAGDVGDGGK